MEPYIFQSGKNRGKMAAILMFKDYRLLHFLLERLNKESRGSKKNRLHEHLLWLMSRGDNRRPVTMCRFCNKKPVKYFSVVYSDSGISVGLNFTCCEDCKGELTKGTALKVPQFYLLTFRSILLFSRKSDQRQVVRLLREVYGLPKRITTQTAWQFFAA